MTRRPTALIAEDELPQRQELRSLLGELWPELDIVAECEDGLSALQALEKQRPDVAFLDIRMPGVSGLEVARAAHPRCQVVFITAYEEYALRAFDEGAVDYLQKPVARDRLGRAVERTCARLAAGARAPISHRPSLTGTVGGSGRGSPTRARRAPPPETCLGSA